MAKKLTKRRVQFLGTCGDNGGPGSITIEISVWRDDLQPDELRDVADGLADAAMESITRAKYTRAPLSRIKVERPR